MERERRLVGGRKEGDSRGAEEEEGGAEPEGGATPPSEKPNVGVEGVGTREESRIGSYGISARGQGGREGGRLDPEMSSTVRSVGPSFRSRCC